MSFAISVTLSLDTIYITIIIWLANVHLVFSRTHELDT